MISSAFPLLGINTVHNARKYTKIIFFFKPNPNAAQSTPNREGQRPRCPRFAPPGRGNVLVARCSPDTDLTSGAALDLHIVKADSALAALPHKQAIPMSTNLLDEGDHISGIAGNA
jgi:hypothetical protein